MGSPNILYGNNQANTPSYSMKSSSLIPSKPSPHLSFYLTLQMAVSTNTSIFSGYISPKYPTSSTSTLPPNNSLYS